MSKKDLFVTIIVGIVGIGVLYLGVLLVLHDVDSLAQSKKRLATQKKLQQYAEQNFEHLQNELQEFSDIMQYTPQSTSKEGVLKLLLTYGKDVRLKKIYTKKEGGVQATYYFAQMRIASPKNLYDLVDMMQKKGYLVRLEWPMRFTKKGKNIDVEFFFTLYRTAFQEKPLPQNPEEEVGL